jgi:multidrug resistance efflux pump
MLFTKRSVTPRSARKPRALCALLGLLALTAGACGDEHLAISGTVEARRVTVSAEMPGRITALAVEQGQAVRTGDLLVTLDCGAPEAQLAQAEAQAAAARAQVALLREGARSEDLAAARAALEIAEQQLAAARRGATRHQRDQLEAALSGVDARLEAARSALARTEELSATGTRPGAELDAARAEVEFLEAEQTRIQAQLDEARGGARREDRAVLEQRVEQARQQVALLEAGARPNELAVAEAQQHASEALVTLARVQAERCRVTAPVDGVVDIVDYDLGETVALGAPLVAIARSGPLRIRTYVPQTRLANLAVGDALNLVADGHPDHPLVARVERVYDEAELTAGNVQTPEDRMLLVYRVDLAVDPDESAAQPSGAFALRPGMTVVVDFDSDPTP